MHRVLFIGVGSIGERHLRCFLATGRIEASICEISDQLRQEVAERYPVTRTYADLQAALADSHDVALIATPAHLHVPMAIRLAEAGMHLLIEKPLSTSLEGVDRLGQLTRERDLKAMVAYFWRSDPALRAMKKAIAEQRFGRPIQLAALCGQNFPFYRPAYRDTYYTDRASGGGAIQDALTHIVNAGEFLVGPVDRLVADAEHKVVEGVEVEDIVHMIARHGDVMASYSLNQFQYPNESSITVNCERGSAKLDMMGGNWRWMDEIGGEWHEESFSIKERDERYIIQANMLLDAVEGRCPPPCSLEEGRQTLRVNLVALRSADGPSTFTEINT